MNLHEFLGKIENCGHSYDYELKKSEDCVHLYIRVTVSNGDYEYRRSVKYATEPNQPRYAKETVFKCPTDFTKSWKYWEAFIEKSLEKIAIDQREVL